MASLPAKTNDPWKQLPPPERPRERLMVLGVGALSDSELLALLLGSGHASSGGVLAVAQRLLAVFGGLEGLAGCNVLELMTVSGIGTARACAVVAAIELAQRRRRGGGLRPEVRSSSAAFRLLQPAFAGLRQELFLVLALDAKCRLLVISEVARGSATHVEVHPREVFAPLVRFGAVSAIVAHNHPSGDCEPSNDDIALTARLVQGGALLGIPVVDHLVVADGGYLSLAERGLL